MTTTTSIPITDLRPGSVDVAELLLRGAELVADGVDEATGGERLGELAGQDAGLLRDAVVTTLARLARTPFVDVAGIRLARMVRQAVDAASRRDR